MNDARLSALGAAAAMLVFAALLAVGLSECGDCKARGGAFVRTTFWYECVEKRP